MDLLSVIASSRRRFVGLLDLYPGAAAAYSLRVLRTAALNDAIVRVRRDSDNDEVNVKADLSVMTNGNYFVTLNSPLVGSAATFGDFMGANNGFVRTLFDPTGNARHAAQATAGNQPQIVAGGALVTVNSKPACLFDGTNDILETAGSVTVNQPATSFHVSRSPNALGVRYVWSINQVSGIIGYRRLERAGIFAGAELLRTGDISSTQILQYGLFNGASSALAINGGVATTASAGTQNANGILRIGGQQGLNIALHQGEIQEAVIFPTNQSANRPAIESNINAAWGVF